MIVQTFFTVCMVSGQSFVSGLGADVKAPAECPDVRIWRQCKHHKLRRASKIEVDVHGMHSRPIVASIDAVMELTDPPRVADGRAGARL
jgi:hypothetical protein